MFIGALTNRRSDGSYRQPTQTRQTMVLRIFVSLVVVTVFQMNGNAISVKATDEYEQFVQEVIAEDEIYYDSSSIHYTHEGSSLKQPEHFSRYETEEQIRREREELQAEEAMRIKELNEKIQKEREDAFEKEIARLKVLGDEVAAKKLLQQKKRDTKLVNRICKAARTNNYYAILGIPTFPMMYLPKINIPKRTITIIPKRFVINIPKIEFFGGISERTIKKAYREMAKLVHPDKNTDSRATEAFVMVENAAEVLFNPTTRMEYDTIMESERYHRRVQFYNQVRFCIVRTIRIIRSTIHTGKKILGPFTVPVIIILALIA